MKTMIKWARLIAATLLTMALLAPSGAALAAEEQGAGTITARGAGYVRLEGGGMVTIGRGAGVVWVTGAEEIKTEGRGRRTSLPDGTIRLTGYSGVITVTGQDMVVRVEGASIGLSATGSGNVFLKGRGGYTVGDGSGTWSKTGTTVTF